MILLDEPFASLDAGLRESTRRAVAASLAAAGATTILVTHDQAEALSLADQVAVMRHGRLVQVAAPGDLYRRPVDVETATSDRRGGDPAGDRAERRRRVRAGQPAAAHTRPPKARPT